MTAILRVALLTVLAAASIPAVAPAQGTSIDSLTRRIVLLEHRVADLEQRVGQLEALIKTEPSPSRSVAPSSNWRDLANWRQLRPGMKMNEVRALLGEPEKVDANPVRTYWYWDYPIGPNAYFDSKSGKLDGWSEP